MGDRQHTSIILDKEGQRTHILSLYLMPSISIAFTRLESTEGRSLKIRPLASLAPPLRKEATHKSTPIVAVVSSSLRKSSSVKRRRREDLPTEEFPISSSLRFGGLAEGSVIVVVSFLSADRGWGLVFADAVFNFLVFFFLFLNQSLPRTIQVHGRA